jgi:hypothetical protein
VVILKLSHYRKLDPATDDLKREAWASGMRLIKKKYKVSLREANEDYNAATPRQHSLRVKEKLASLSSIRYCAIVAILD